MKKPSLCCVVLIIVWGALMYPEIRDTFNGNKMNFLARMYYSNPGYDKNIEIMLYLLTNEQVIQSLAHPDVELQQPTLSELYSKEVNVVLRIKNLENAKVWGTLGFELENRLWSYLDVELPPINPEENNPSLEYVIPYGNIVFSNKKTLPTPMQIKWIALYSD